MSHEQPNIPEKIAQGKRLRYLSVCSGMEAASVAWHPLGWKPVGFSEIEPFPCAILKHRFPDVPNYGSLTEYQSWPLEPGAIDLLVGGTPCQSFSVAGLRKGLADPRGNLALTFLGLADKLKPKWIVWENVPGVLSSGGGRDFGSFLGALVELGYGFAYRVLDAQHFGVPQRRRRVFVVACLGDWRAAAEVLSLREGLRGYLASGGKKRKGVASDAGSGVEASGTVTAKWAKGSGGPAGDECQNLIAQQTPCWWDGGQVSQTLDAVLQKGQSMPDKNRFPAVLQPISHWDGSDIHPTLNQSAKGSGGVGSSNQELFSQGGAYLVPGAPIPFRKSKRAQSVTDNETWVLADSSNTLNNFDLGDTRTTHAVVEPKVHCADVAPTVTSSGPPYSRTGNERVEAEAMVVQPVSFQPGNLVRKAGADPSTETFPTLTKDSGDQSPHVAHQVYENSRRDALRIYEGTSPTLQSFMGTGGCNVPMVQPAMAVRRLTPVECERLQGFPDNWSRIPWKGKSENECPDGPRYKACGNSMAVPVMAFIGNNIADYEAKA